MTGSKGNAIVIEENILIDCGISFKKLKDYYKQFKKSFFFLNTMNLN